MKRTKQNPNKRRGVSNLAISNFKYDNISLSNFNNGKYILGYFSTDENPTEGQRNYNQTPLFLGLEQPFVYSNYEDTLTFTLSIVKNPCVTDEDSISVIEMEALKRWLCRPAPHKFELDGEEYANIYWEGTFQIEEEIIGAKRAGVTLTFISTRPYALQKDVIFEGTIENIEDDTLTINDVSTEIGYTYPTIQITCKEAGDLIIYNSFDDRQTIVNNCRNNEVITFTRYLQITTNVSSHEIQDDFNYKFLRIGNNYSTRTNTLSFSIPCEYVITYNPIRKVLPI